MAKEQKETIIRLNWDAQSYPLSDFKTRNEGERHLMKPEDWGIYQIYGVHPIYGAESLLYIGTSREGNNHTDNPLAPIGERIHARVGNAEWGNSYYADCRVYIGRFVQLESEVRKQIDRAGLREVIPLVEALMIYYHQPACNGENVYTLSASTKIKRRNLRVMNFGNYRQLQTELSSQHYREVCNFAGRKKTFQPYRL